MQNAPMQQIQGHGHYLPVQENTLVRDWLYEMMCSKPFSLASLLGDNHKAFQKLYAQIAPVEDDPKNHPNVYTRHVAHAGMQYLLICNQNSGFSGGFTRQATTLYCMQYQADKSAFAADISAGHSIRSFLSNILLLKQQYRLN